MFVPTVERIYLRRGRNRSSKSEDATHPTPAQDVSVALGGLGAASIRCRQRKWSWFWAVGDTAGVDYHPRIMLGPEIPSFDELSGLKSSSGKDEVAGDKYEAKFDKSTKGVSHVDAAQAISCQSLMAVVQNPEARFGRISICWVAEHNCNQLFLASFLPVSNATYLGQTQTTLNLPITYSEMFDSQILQVVSSSVPSSSRNSHGSTALIVRSTSKTHLLHAEPDPSFVPPSTTPPISLRRMGQLSPIDTDNLAHVDVALDTTSWGRSILVDEGGNVWLWSEASQQADQFERAFKLRKIGHSSKSEVDQGDAFYRVAFGSRPDTVLVMSRTVLEIIDLLRPSERHTLLTLSNGEIFIALEKSGPSRDSGLVCAVTNHEVLWINDAGDGRVALKWKHDCGGGTLSNLEFFTASILPSLDEELSYIAMVRDPISRSITAVQATTNRPLTLLSQPWSTAHLSTISRTIETLVSLPTQFTRATNYLQVCGIVNQRAAGFVEADTNVELGFHSSWKRRDNLQARWAWIAINDVASSATLDLEEFQKELRADEAPLHHLTTLAELARDYGYQRSTHSRSNLLRALRFSDGFTFDSVDRIITNPGHFPLVERVGHLDEIAVQRTNATTQSAYERDIWLCYDLLLSSAIVFSATDESSRHVRSSSNPASTPEDIFAAATENLSLEENSPNVRFSFLTPKTVAQPNGNCSMVSSPPFAQTLINEWEVEESPTSYQWQQSSRASSPQAFNAPRPIKPLPPSRPSIQPPVSQKQPTHSNYQWPSLSSPVRPPPRKSSPIRSQNRTFVAEDDLSIPNFLQTQTEPGPYGARPETRVTKKKSSKRRQGGF